MSNENHEDWKSWQKQAFLWRELFYKEKKLNSLLLVRLTCYKKKLSDLQKEYDRLYARRVLEQ